MVDMKRYLPIALVFASVCYGADLASTPPMGWNSWNNFAGKIDDKTVREIADAMVSTGMKDAGYVYVNIDDCWQGERDAEGHDPAQRQISRHEGARRLHPRQGPEVRASIPRPAPRPARATRAATSTKQQDAKTLRGLGRRLSEVRLVQRRASLQARRRCRPSTRRCATRCRPPAARSSSACASTACANVWEWGASVGGNLWRTTGDIDDTWTEHVHASASTPQDGHRAVRRPRPLERSRHAGDRQRRHERTTSTAPT